MRGVQCGWSGAYKRRAWDESEVLGGAESGYTCSTVLRSLDFLLRAMGIIILRAISRGEAWCHRRLFKNRTIDASEWPWHCGVTSHCGSPSYTGPPLMWNNKYSYCLSQFELGFMFCATECLVNRFILIRSTDSHHSLHRYAAEFGAVCEMCLLCFTRECMIRWCLPDRWLRGVTTSANEQERLSWLSHARPWPSEYKRTWWRQEILLLKQ